MLILSSSLVLLVSQRSSTKFEAFLICFVWVPFCRCKIDSFDCCVDVLEIHWFILAFFFHCEDRHLLCWMFLLHRTNTEFHDDSILLWFGWNNSLFNHHLWMDQVNVDISPDSQLCEMTKNLHFVSSVSVSHFSVDSWGGNKLPHSTLPHTSKQLKHLCHSFQSLDLNTDLGSCYFWIQFLILHLSGINPESEQFLWRPKWHCNSFCLSHARFLNLKSRPWWPQKKQWNNCDSMNITITHGDDVWISKLCSGMGTN